MTTALPVTMETFGKVQSLDPSGRAWALYCFYARAAVKQESSQPLCTDMFCKNGLHWKDIKTVRKFRKVLQRAGAVSLERKFPYSYVTVNYLTVRLKNKRFELSETPVESHDYQNGLELLDTAWPEWWERLSGSCFDEFMKRLKKVMEVCEMPDYNEAFHHLNVVYGRMEDPLTGIWCGGPRCELDFWNYLLRGVANEFAAHKDSHESPSHSTQKTGRMKRDRGPKNG